MEIEAIVPALEKAIDRSDRTLSGGLKRFGQLALLEALNGPPEWREAGRKALDALAPLLLRAISQPGPLQDEARLVLRHLVEQRDPMTAGLNAAEKLTLKTVAKTVEGTLFRE